VVGLPGGVELLRYTPEVTARKLEEWRPMSTAAGLG
jgi:hypothetical protein